MKGRRQVKEGFLSLETIEIEWHTHNPRVNGQDKYLSAFERGKVVGARRTGLSVSRTATLQGFSRSTISRVYQYILYSSQATQASPPHKGQHGPASLWNAFDTLPQYIEAVLRAKGGATPY